MGAGLYLENASGSFDWFFENLQSALEEHGLIVHGL